jgi:glyoxylase-like metal-dependent hydrolase (beta-lactamase superfamily II)
MCVRTSSWWRAETHRRWREPSSVGRRREVVVRVVDEGGWFRVTARGEGITLVEEPYAGELVSANLWHVRGRDRDLVLDAGLGVVALRRELPWLFEHDPVLVLSHAHLDHMGGAHEFVDVRVHEAELAEATAPGPSSLRTRRLLQLLGLDAEAAEAGDDDVLLDALPSDAYDLDAYRLHGAAAGGVRDGDVIDLGDRAFAVVHLPGHTPGSLTLLDADARVLLSGDVVYEGGLIDSCTGSDVHAYRESMQRLLGLDVERVLPGHGPELDRTRLRAIANDYLSSTQGA